MSRLPPHLRAEVDRRKRARKAQELLDARTSEWFAEQRAFYDDPAQLTAALCGRRAGKTRGGCLHFLREAVRTPNGRFLYLNATRGEARRLAWHGLRGDGMYQLARSLNLNFKADQAELTLHFPDTDSWIFFRGADDEAGVAKALGLAYHEVWWDEAQKIPGKLEQTIREVLMPTLLDYDGRLRLTGTPVRHMAGLFYNVTRGDAEALDGWSVHRWNLLANHYFGRTERRGKWWVVLSKVSSVISSHATEEEAAARATRQRYEGGLMTLQTYFGGPKSAPIDGPLMRREGLGHWVREDSAFVYDVHKIPEAELLYAPARTRSLVLEVPRMAELDRPPLIEEVVLDGFPDFEHALRDLPAWPEREYFLALAADIGFKDPFATTMVAWSLVDPVLYEVGSWGASYLDQPTQAAVLRWICDHFRVGIVTADGGGSVLPTVKGWSEEWTRRYGIPIDEIEKTNKAQAIEACNGDLRRGQYRLRAGGRLHEQFSRVQWAALRTSSGRVIEDPSIPNDVADTGLYAHRRSYQHRFRPVEPGPPRGSPEALEREIEAEIDREELEVYDRWH